MEIAEQVMQDMAEHGRSYVDYPVMLPDEIGFEVQKLMLALGEYGSVVKIELTEVHNGWSVVVSSGLEDAQ